MLKSLEWNSSRCCHSRISYQTQISR